jgi:glycopeptide antibiotics resistance protein
MFSFSFIIYTLLTIDATSLLTSSSSSLLLSGPKRQVNIFKIYILTLFLSFRTVFDACHTTPNQKGTRDIKSRVFLKNSFFQIVYSTNDYS